MSRLSTFPHGRTNEPCTLPLVVKSLAELYNVSIEEVADVTTANAMSLFQLQPIFLYVLNSLARSRKFIIILLTILLLPSYFKERSCQCSVLCPIMKLLYFMELVVVWKYNILPIIKWAGLSQEMVQFHVLCNCQVYLRMN